MNLLSYKGIFNIQGDYGFFSKKIENQINFVYSLHSNFFLPLHFVHVSMGQIVNHFKSKNILYFSLKIQFFYFDEKTKFVYYLAYIFMFKI